VVKGILPRNSFATALYPFLYRPQSPVRRFSAENFALFKI